MCVMSGCDFLRGLSSIGIKKAHAHIRRLKSFVRVRRMSHNVGEEQHDSMRELHPDTLRAK